MGKKLPKVLTNHLSAEKKIGPQYIIETSSDAALLSGKPAVHTHTHRHTRTHTHKSCLWLLPGNFFVWIGRAAGGWWDQMRAGREDGVVSSTEPGALRASPSSGLGGGIRPTLQRCSLRPRPSPFPLRPRALPAPSPCFPTARVPGSLPVLLLGITLNLCPLLLFCPQLARLSWAPARYLARLTGTWETPRRLHAASNQALRL